MRGYGLATTHVKGFMTSWLLDCRLEKLIWFSWRVIEIIVGEKNHKDGVFLLNVNSKIFDCELEKLKEGFKINLIC
jgi:hypothetical protein